MIRVARRLILNRHFILPFIRPIIVVLILNAGIILHLPNYFNLFPEAVEYLSEVIENTYSISLFIGFVTIFILFFTFVQFSLTQKNLPTEIIRKYIVEDEISFNYIGVQFSFALLLAFFSLDNEKIHRINSLLGFLIILFSVIFTLLYFLWLVRNITSIGVFKIIMKKLDFKEIVQIGNQYNRKQQDFNKLLKSAPITFEINKYEFFIPDDKKHEFIYTNRRGFVDKVDIERIVKILLPYSAHINKVVLDVKIGNYLPKFEPLPEYPPYSILLWVEKIFLRKETNEFKNFVELLNNNKFKKELENCFEIYNRGNIYKNNLDFIEDLLYFFLNAIEKEPSIADKIIEQFSAFVKINIEDITNSGAVNDIGLSENLYLKLIDLCEDKIRECNINSIAISPIISFVYAFRNLAIKHKSIKLIEATHNLLNTLFYRILVDTDRYTSYISTQLLYIQELSFSSLAYGETTPTSSDLCLNWKTFYNPLIVNSINTAITGYKILIKYFHKRHIDDNYRILLSNAQHLINFLSPFDYWEPFEDIERNHNSVFEKEREKIIYYLARNIVYISIMLFKRVKEDKFPKWLVLEVCFPLSLHCNTIAKRDIKVEDILTKLFFDYNFYGPLSHLFSEEFEINKVHEASSYSPAFYDFQPYWYTLSLHFHRIKKPYIPSTVPNRSEFNLDRLQTFIRSIDKYDATFYMDLFKLNVDEYNSSKNSYKEHLQNLLDNK